MNDDAILGVIVLAVTAVVGCVIGSFTTATLLAITSVILR